MVFAAAEEWGGGNDPRGPRHLRIGRAARELAGEVARREMQATDDPYENPTPFEQMLSDG